MPKTTEMPACIGRETELDSLAGFLDKAVGGQGSIVFVTGEPGAGKSTLLQEFIRRSEQRLPELVLAFGDCNPQTGTVDPYLPFREILSGLTLGEDSSAATSRPAGSFLSAAKKMLAEHGPDLIDLFVPGGALVTRVGAQAAEKLRGRGNSRPAGPSRAVRPGGGELDQSHIFEQYTNVIRSLASSRPLALIIEDLHWGDEASISLLFHLSRRVESLPVMLIGTYRENEILAGRGASRHPLESWLNELKRYHGEVWIELDRVQEREGRAFVDLLLDAEPNRLGPEFRQSLYDRTDGQPLFTTELLRHLKDGGALTRDEDGLWHEAGVLTWEGLPLRIEGVIGERASRLTNEELELMSGASVLGETFHAEALARLLGQPVREVVRRLSGDLTRRHMLVRAVGFDRLAGIRLSSYEFRHSLFHHYFYDTLDPVERGMLHEDAAAALEELFSADRAPVAVKLARHFLEASLDDRAIEYLLLAGSEALRVYANAEARNHFQAALSTLEQLESRRGLSAGEIERLRRQTRRSLGEVLVLDGEFREAREFYEQALQPLGAENRLDAVDLLCRIATTHEREHDHDKALQALERADQRLLQGYDPSVDEERSAWISIRTARLWLHYWRANLDGMESVIDEAGAVIEMQGDPSQKRMFYTACAGYQNRKSGFIPDEQVLALSEQALQAAMASDKLIDQAHGQFGTGFTFLLGGEFERAQELLEDALERASRSGDRTLQARCLTYLAMLHRRAGQSREAHSRIRQAEAVCEALEMHEYLGVTEACRAWLALQEGDDERAASLARGALRRWADHAPRYPFRWLAYLPLIDISCSHDEDSDQAAGLAKELISPPSAGLPPAIVQAFEAAIGAQETGDAEAAGRLRRALEASRNSGYL